MLIPQKDLLPLLDHIDVLRTPLPVFVINWETMEINNVRHRNYIWNKETNVLSRQEPTGDGFEVACCKYHILQNIKSAVKFVEDNSKKIVICKFVFPSYDDPSTDGACSDPRPMLQYAMNPKL